jgi:hypothetical protein
MQMPNKTFRMNANAALLGLIAAAYPVVGSSAPAARVDFAVGNVQAVGANGQSRNLAKGAQLEQGETIATNNGRAQLRFTDGAYVSLQPESEFRIDQYRFDGKQDGNEKGFFSLVKGGLRTITGLVGRNNKNNYQINTSVATIGIRGTEYTIQYGQSITGSVGEGEIEVCNGAGCLNVTNGESYYVQNQEIKPVLTNKRTDLPPPSPQNPPSTFAEGEQVNESGDPCTLFPSTCGTSTALLTGTGKFNVAYAGTFFGPGVALESDATLDNGQLISFNRGFADTLNGPFSDVGGDDILVWGRAASNTGGEVTHYVAGIPTSDLSALGGMIASYSMAGATQITGSGGTVVGKLNAMTMTADFWSAGFTDLSVTMKMTLGSTDRNSITGSGSMSNGVLSFFASQSLASGSLSVSANGFFAGTNAARAGFAYDVFDNELGIGGKGAVGLKQTGVAPSSGGNF